MVSSFMLFAVLFTVSDGVQAFGVLFTGLAAIVTALGHIRRRNRK